MLSRPRSYFFLLVFFFVFFLALLFLRDLHPHVSHISLPFHNEVMVKDTPDIHVQIVAVLTQHPEQVNPKASPPANGRDIFYFLALGRYGAVE